MEALSIAASCAGLITIAAQTTGAIKGFVRKWREAREDLAAISCQLSELGVILDLLKDDCEATGGRPRIPTVFHSQLPPILSNCTDIIKELSTLLVKHQSRPGLKWAVSGKEKTSSL
jgi:hypothetical protein